MLWLFGAVVPYVDEKLPGALVLEVHFRRSLTGGLRFVPQAQQGDSAFCNFCRPERRSKILPNCSLAFSLSFATLNESQIPSFGWNIGGRKVVANTIASCCFPFTHTGLIPSFGPRFVPFNSTSELLAFGFSDGNHCSSSHPVSQSSKVERTRSASQDYRRMIVSV